MKNLLIAYTLLLFTFPLIAADHNRSDRVSSFERDTYKEMIKAALITDIKFTCSSRWQKQMEEVTAQIAKAIADVKANLPNADSNHVENSINNLKREYENLFSCEEAIQQALQQGVSEARIQRILNTISKLEQHI